MPIKLGYGQQEVLFLQDIIKDCKIITTAQTYEMLRKKGKNEEQISKIIETLVKTKNAYFDESKTYLLASPLVGTSEMTSGLKKAIWLYIHEMDKIDFVTFIVKMPSVMLFTKPDKKDVAGNKELYIVNAFHIPNGQENMCLQAINSGYGMNETNAIIIVDELAQIGRLELSKKFNVLAFATVDNKTGEVTYYK